jgi:hypothetical protein
MQAKNDTRGHHMAKSKKSRIANAKRSKRHPVIHLPYDKLMAAIADEVKANESDRQRRRALTYRR